MHEASMMVGLMHRIDAIAKAERARRIVGVSVRIGALCHMSVEHFGEHFQRASLGTLAEGARMDVTVSQDMGDKHAQDILLEHVEVET